MDNKLDFLMELIHCSHPLYHWVYSEQGVLLESNVGENERIMDIFFHAEGVKSYMLDYVKTNTLSQDTEQEKKKNLPWVVEQALFDNIRIGNLNYRAALSNAASVSSGLGIETGDSIQRALYSGIVFTALATRAAIDGGLSPQLAYTIQNRYTKNLESAKNMTEMAHINHQMYEEFIRRVHDLNQYPNLSPQIRNCRNYIELHATEKITLQEIAKHIGYTEYYLSRRFQKETGVSINTYIKETKIRQAKILLSSSTMSIQDISDTFAFCSRSHFSDTFRKMTGLSPLEYRNQHQK